MDKSTFDLIAGAGVGIVVFGVTLEGTELLIKIAEKRGARKWIKREFSPRWLFSLICFNRRIRPVILWIEGIAIGIVIAGLAIEQFGDSGAKRIQSQENATLILEAGNATNVAAQAMRTAAQFNFDAEQARVEAEILRSNNLELQKQLQPRMISIEQSNKFISLFKECPPVNVKVSCTADDNEAFRYATQIKNMLNAAGFGSTNDSVDENYGTARELANAPLPFSSFDIGFYFYGTNQCVRPIPTPGFIIFNNMLPVLYQTNAMAIGAALIWGFKQIQIQPDVGETTSFVTNGQLDVFIPSKTH